MFALVSHIFHSSTYSVSVRSLIQNTTAGTAKNWIHKRGRKTMTPPLEKSTAESSWEMIQQTRRMLAEEERHHSERTNKIKG